MKYDLWLDIVLEAWLFSPTILESESKLAWFSVSLDAVRQIIYSSRFRPCELLVATCYCIPLFPCMYYLLQEFCLILYFIFLLWCVFVICANDLSILRMDFIHYKNVITVFALFVESWYLLNIVTVVLVTTNVTVAIVTAWTSALMSWGLMRVRK